MTQHIDIKTYNKTQLQALLRYFKKSQYLTKTLGKRGMKILSDNLDHTEEYRIEYHPNFLKQDMLEHVKKIYQDVFGKKVGAEDITWKENKNIFGGFRLFYNDMMVDISFMRVKQKIT